MKTVITFWLAFLTIFVWSIACYSQPYTLVTYEEARWGTSIVIKKLDLGSRNEIASATLQLPGELVIKVPFQISFLRSQLSVVITTDGVPCKNGSAGRPITRYVVLDRLLNIINMDSLVDLGIYELLSKSEDSIIAAYTRVIADTGLVTEKGSFGLARNLRLVRGGGYPFNYDPENARQVGRYTYPRRLPHSSAPIYWDTADNFEVYILMLNAQRTRILDSLSVGNFLAYSQLFGVSAADSLLYIFSLSYDIPRGGGRLAHRNNAPSFVRKYRVADFSLTDSISVPNIVPDTDYVRNELGPCDVVGPFMVYYFFKGDDYRYFSPAMLFIFDTRTNEATWLRVGWR